MMRRQSCSGDFNTAQFVFNLMQNFPKQTLVIDVRDPQDFDFCHIHSSINIPYSDNYSDFPDINELKDHIRHGGSIFERRRRMLIVIVFSPPAIVFARAVHYILRRDKCREVHILEEELATFGYKYSFLCEGLKSEVCKRPAHGYPSEILPFQLYLGDHYHAEDPLVIQNLKITHIINATNSCEAKFLNKGVLYLRLGVEDLETEDLSKHFSKAYEFLTEALSSDKNRVLVHCARGISRSATIVIMFIMKSMKISYDEALSFVKKHREVVCPNEGFEQQLRAWNSELKEDLHDTKTECKVMIE